MKEWKDNDHCYNYNEKYVPSHHYKTHNIYLLNDDIVVDSREEDDEIEMEDAKKEIDNLAYVIPKISFNALARISSP